MKKRRVKPALCYFFPYYVNIIIWEVFISKTIITISMDSDFADKFIGFLKNLISINSDKRSPLTIDSIAIDDGESEIVAYPKEKE